MRAKSSSVKVSAPASGETKRSSLRTFGLACALCAVLLVPVVAGVSAALPPPCSWYAGIQGQVQCGHAGQTLVARSGSCEEKTWVLGEGGYFGYKKVNGNGGAQNYNFYLDGTLIGTVSLTTCLSGSCTRNVTLSVCPPVTTTPVTCESYNITGWVLDCNQPPGYPSSPVAGATVFVLGHPELGVATTNSEGCFDLGAAPAGTYTVMAVSGGKSAYADVTLPDVIPPCGDCLQVALCIESSGPCPNAASSDECCSLLATADPALHDARCAAAATTPTTTGGATTTTTTDATPMLAAVMVLVSAAWWAARRAGAR